MAANYWTSTHHSQWTFTAAKLQSTRSALDASHSNVIAQYPLPDQRLIFIFLRDQLLKLARRLPTRQPILSTTLLYLARYWLLRPIRATNPFLLLATCFYLASKTEELPHHIRLVLAEAKNLWPEFIPGDVYRMGECEFEVISALRSQLIIFHPYTLIGELSGRGDQNTGPMGGGASGSYSGSSLGVGMNSSNAFASQQGYRGYGQSPGYNNTGSRQHSQTGQDIQDDGGPQKRWNLGLTQEETAMAWSIVNDSYLTDLPLTQPPHVVAVMALFLAVVFQPSRAPGLNLHSISAQQQQQQQQASPQYPGGTQQFHALPPKPGTFPAHPQQPHHAASLGGQHSRSIASALRDSMASSSPQSTSSTTTAPPNTNRAGGLGAGVQPPPKVKKMISFLAESEIDLERVVDATQEIVSLYEVWEGYSEKGVREAISRFVRGRGLDK